jgi:alpha-mannosidase
LLFTPQVENRHVYSVTITLYDGLPNIEIIWNIENKPAEPWPEAGWMCFPLNISNPEFRLGRLGGIVDPTKDFIKGSNFDYCFLNSGMAIVNDHEKGMGFCSPDVPAISLEKPGLWQYSGFAVPKKPKVFFNLYNNQWSTNFTEWIEGSWSARFYLWGIDEYDNESSITTPSEEVRVPFKSVLVSGPAGKLPDHATGISLSKKGILVTAFCNNPDGEGTLLRLWENSGNSGSCTITLPRNSNYKYGEFCNLRGELKNKIVNVEDGKIEVHINAYQPVSLALHQYNN